MPFEEFEYSDWLPQGHFEAIVTAQTALSIAFPKKWLKIGRK
jgi:hypothetical protein